MRQGRNQLPAVANGVDCKAVAQELGVRHLESMRKQLGRGALSGVLAVSSFGACWLHTGFRRI